MKLGNYGLVFLLITALGFLLGEKSLSQKHTLEEHKFQIGKENQSLEIENQNLERKITLLRSDKPTIEKAAKSKLGMAGPDETIYLFDSKGIDGSKP
jgi:cell division protein FtsB